MKPRAQRIVIDGRGSGTAGTGIARYVRALVSGLARLQVSEARVLCWRSERTAIRTLGIPPWPIPVGKLFRPWQLPGAALTHGPNFTPLHLRGAQQIITIHDLAFLQHPSDFPQGLIKELLEGLRRHQRTIALAICVSSATEADVLEAFPGFAGKTAVIHHGVDGRWFTPPSEGVAARSLASLRIKRPFLLHTGALVPRKDLPTLVRAWILLNEDGFNLDLVLAGPDAVGWKSDLEVITALAHKCGWQDRLHVLGYVDDVTARSLLSEASVYVCPSKFEGFGLPVLEAMASRTPVVATDLPALREIAADTITYAPVGDAEGIAQATADVLRGSQAASIERARQRAKGFSWTRCAEETLAWYRRVLNG